MVTILLFKQIQNLTQCTLQMSLTRRKFIVCTFFSHWYFKYSQNTLLWTVSISKWYSMLLWSTVSVCQCYSMAGGQFLSVHVTQWNGGQFASDNITTLWTVSNVMSWWTYSSLPLTYCTGGQFYLKAKHEEPQDSSTDPGIAVVPGVHKVRGEKWTKERKIEHGYYQVKTTGTDYPAAQD